MAAQLSSISQLGVDKGTPCCNSPLCLLVHLSVHSSSTHLFIYISNCPFCYVSAHPAVHLPTIHLSIYLTIQCSNHPLIYIYPLFILLPTCPFFLESVLLSINIQLSTGSFIHLLICLTFHEYSTHYSSAYPPLVHPSNIQLSILLAIPVCLPVVQTPHPSIYSSIHPLIHLSICPSTCLFFHATDCPSVHPPSIHPTIHPFTFPTIELNI